MTNERGDEVEEKCEKSGKGEEEENNENLPMLYQLL
jgi:hypothetical protein